MTTLHKANRDNLIYLLRDYGFTYREIGHLFGISRQRACQIYQDIEDGYEPIITNNEERLRLKKVKLIVAMLCVQLEMLSEQERQLESEVKDEQTTQD